MSLVVTGDTGSGTSLSAAVPSNAAAGTVMVALLHTFSTDAASVFTSGAPAGWNFGAEITASNQGVRGRYLYYWKRCTAADSGTYTWTVTTSATWTVVIAGMTNLVTVGTPWNVPPTGTNGLISDATTLAANGVTPLGATSTIIAFGANAGGGSWTPPSGWTERYDAGTRQTLIQLDSPVAGTPTGSITFTCSGSGYMRALALALATDDHVATRDATFNLFTATTARTVTLPAHEPGDRITIVVSGKSESTTVPTISSGWTLVKSGTGGTGSLAADTGQMFVAVYMRDVVAGESTLGGTPITNPTVTPGATAPDTWNAIASVATPSTGKAMRDAIASNADYVQLISDTDTATSGTGGTASAMTGQPRGGDAIHVFSCHPTDSLTTWTAAAASASGLTNGSVAATTVVNSSTVQTAQGTSVFNRNSLGTDSSMGFFDWVDFDGTATSGITASVTTNSSNQSGVVVVVAHRQTTGGTTINGGQATSTSTAQAGSVVSGSVISGGVATSTSTALAGALLLGYLVAGGTATETNTAQAGAIATGQNVNGGQSSETDTASTGSVVGGALVAGGQATETDTVAAGVLSQAVTGAQASETDTAAVGTVLYVVTGGQAGETDTALHGSVGDEGLVVGGQSSETDTAVAGTVDAGYIGGATDNIDDGIDLDGTALVEWEPAVVATPAKYANILAMDTARVVELTSIGPAGQPLITVQNAQAQRARDRILIGGADFTYFRGVNTPTPDFRLIKPLLWGSGTLVLPQVNPQYELLGPGASGALRRIKDGAIVVVQRVLDNVVIATDYVGFIDAIDTSGRVLSLTLGGHASGRAARDYVPPPVFRKRHDAEFQILNYLRTLNLRTTRGGEVGIPLTDRGGQDGLSLVNELVSLAVKADGTTYDVMPTSGRVFDMVETDRTTIDATVYFDDVLATQQLARAFSEEPNVVYATGRTKRGEIVNNAKAPGLVQGDAPAFPGDKELGNTGAAVILIQQQLTIGGFLNYADLDDEGTFDQDTADAVAELQEEAGLATVAAAGGWLGKVNSITWDTLWDLDVIGYSIDRARIFPMAQRDYTRKWNFAANGGKRSRNRDWDPHRIKSAVSISDGLTGFNRRRIKRFARSKLAPSDVSNWQGTLALTSGVIAGEHTPGDPITAADVMPARALRPGMNLWAPLFDGGTLFHISGVDVSNGGGSVSLILDTQARDTMAAWEAISRNRETRSNPARAWSGHTRASSVEHDTMADWTDICGNLAHQIPLVAEGWTEVMVPAGQEGVVQKIRMQLDPADEFAVILSQRPIGLAMLNSRIPTPLTEPATGRPWYEREAITDWLDDRGKLDAWGTPKQPCGYDPSLKTDASGPTGQPITGLFVETAGLNYEAAQPGRLFLYVWTWTNSYLQPGRILTQQLTSAV